MPLNYERKSPSAQAFACFAPLRGGAIGGPRKDGEAGCVGKRRSGKASPVLVLKKPKPRCKACSDAVLRDFFDRPPCASVYGASFFYNAPVFCPCKNLTANGIIAQFAHMLNKKGAEKMEHTTVRVRSNGAKAGAVWQFAAQIALALGVGALSAWLTRGNMDLFRSIKKPPLTPPAAVFPVVWTILFILMGAGAALVQINRRGKEAAARAAMRAYALQLAANLTWSLIFFNARAFLLAFFWLLLLLWLIVLTVRRFALVSPLAAKLQIPYLLWVGFAGYLTLAIYLLNR